MKRICELSFKDAVNIIKDTKQVYFRKGIWNPYKLVDTSYAIDRINRSGYGADVYLNDEDGMYYVSCPCSSDMW